MTPVKSQIRSKNRVNNQLTDVRSSLCGWDWVNLGWETDSTLPLLRLFVL